MKVMGDILAEAKEVIQTSYKCPIELRDPMVPKVFAVSKRAQEELPNFPQDLREAISLGRMALDPAVEVAQLFNQDDDVLCLQLSPFQTTLKAALWPFLVSKLYSRKKYSLDTQLAHFDSLKLADFWWISTFGW